MPPIRIRSILLLVFGIACFHPPACFGQDAATTDQTFGSPASGNQSGVPESGDEAEELPSSANEGVATEKGTAAWTQVGNWIGAWKNTKAGTDLVSNFEVLKNETGDLTIRIGTATGNDAFVKETPLQTLSLIGGKGLMGVAVIDGQAVRMVYQIELDGDTMLLQAMRIPKANAAAGRFLREEFTRTGQPSNASNRTSANPSMEDSSTAGDGDSESQESEPDFRGVLTGQIESGSVLRGRLTLDPLPEGIKPAEPIAVSTSAPTFRFENVPSGEYTLVFEGTVRGNRRDMKWEKLKPSKADQESPLQLSTTNR